MSLAIRSAIIFAIVFFFIKIDFRPQVSTEYFFAASDPVYLEYQKISNMFPPKDSLILVVKSKVHSIYSGQYFTQVAKLTNKVRQIKGVGSVFSLSHGPKDNPEAHENLMWKEIIFGESNDSTLITSAINKKANPYIVKDFEKVVAENTLESFEINFSGSPYIIEMIKRYISADLKIFALVFFAVSSVVLFVLFGSWQIMLGSLITGVSAVSSSLILMHCFKITFGILSPSVLIMIFLITQAHIISGSSPF